VELGRSFNASWRTLAQNFDFGGLSVVSIKNLPLPDIGIVSTSFMFMSGTSSIIVGFSFATDSGCEDDMHFTLINGLKHG
jgi:hypothetical protein